MPILWIAYKDTFVANLFFKSKTYRDIVKILDIERYTRFMDVCLGDMSKRLLLIAMDCPNSDAYVKTHPDLIGLLANASTRGRKLAGIGVSPVSIDEAGAVGEEKQSADKKFKVSKNKVKEIHGQ